MEKSYLLRIQNIVDPIERLNAVKESLQHQVPDQYKRWLTDILLSCLPSEFNENQKDWYGSLPLAKFSNWVHDLSIDRLKDFKEEWRGIVFYVNENVPAESIKFSEALDFPDDLDAANVKYKPYNISSSSSNKIDRRFHFEVNDGKGATLVIIRNDTFSYTPLGKVIDPREEQDLFVLRSKILQESVSRQLLQTEHTMKEVEIEVELAEMYSYMLEKMKIGDRTDSYIELVLEEIKRMSAPSHLDQLEKLKVLAALNDFRQNILRITTRRVSKLEPVIKDRKRILELMIEATPPLVITKPR